jgi:hypothetical protein
MTETESIKKAIDVLTIQDVYLHESRLTVVDEYDPKYGPPAAHTNIGWGSKSAQIVELEHPETKEKHTLWRVHFVVRCRFLKQIEPAPQKGYEPKPEEILATIESIFIAEYLLKDTSIKPEALAAFAKHNVAYHIWPYWRELLHDTTARALLPRVTLPMHVFRPEASPSVESSTPTEPEISKQ